MKEALKAIAGRLFRDDDRWALGHGWEITPTRFGLGRLYRDPRFSQLARCPGCRGGGAVGDLPCPRCAGSGRITVATALPRAPLDGQRLPVASDDRR